MATFYWQGGADAVAQVDTASIDTLDATPGNNTFTLTVGDDSVSTPGNSTVAQTATDLVALANDGNTTGPHMSVITFANPSGGNITATADTAGVPFVATLSVTGAGNGTVTDFASTTANAGPASAGTIANYIDSSTGNVATALPGAGDTLILRNSAGNISFDLSALTGNGINIVVEQSYTGLVGLDDDTFATDANGGTPVSAREPRTRYLTGAWSDVIVGRHTGTGSPTGSTRVMLSSTYTAAASITIENTASSSADDFKPPVRLLIANANTDVFVERAPGGVGIAVDRAGETSTAGDISIAGSNAVVVVGDGVTFGNFTQAGGTNKIVGSAGNVTEVKTTGGTLDIGGDFLATTLTVEGGTVTDRHIKTGGNLATTVNVRGGTYDLSASDATRAIGTLTRTGGQVRLNPAVSYTTLDLGRGTVSD